MRRPALICLAANPAPSPTASPPSLRRLPPGAIARAGLALALPVMLAACGTGFDTFLGDTTSYDAMPNAPIGDLENLRRVRAQPSEVAPLQPEAGNIWPGPPPPVPSLEDIQKATNPQVPNGPIPAPSSAPPGVPPPISMPAPSRSIAPQTGETVPPPPGIPPAGTTVPTTRGPATSTGTGEPGFQQYNGPNGAGGILVPNGNGTSTLIRPDGSVETVPTPGK